MRRRFAAPGAALALLPWCELRAQQPLEVTLDAGVASVTYDEYARSSAFVLAPALVAAGPRSSVEARSALSLFEGGSRSVQLGAGGRVASPMRAGLSVELAADAGLTAYNDVPVIGYGRAELVGRYQSGAAWQLAAGPTLGAVSNRPGGRTLVGFTASLSGGDRRAAYGCRVTPTRVGTFGYADTELWGGWSAGRVELGGTAGLRAGGAAVDGSLWLNGAATVWLARRYGVVAGVGHYPADLAQGVPGGRFATLAVRFRTPRRAAGVRPGAAALARTIARPTAATVNPGNGASAAHDLRLTPRRGGVYRIVLRAPGAASVELMGDFTSWQPVPLRAAGGGRWEVALPIMPGARRLNVRLDGGAWTVPDGVATVEDDFGSVVGVLSVY